MDRIFFHRGEDDSEARINEITEYIYKCFIPESFEIKKAIIYYLDAHINPKQYIYDPLQTNSIDGNLLIQTLSYLATACRELEIRIITKESLRELRADLATKDRILNIQHPDEKGCTFKIGEYTSPPLNRHPTELHDRWLLMKVDNLYVTGLHLGGSLNSYSSVKDITFTHFDHTGCRQALTRFDHIWSFCEQQK